MVLGLSKLYLAVILGVGKVLTGTNMTFDLSQGHMIIKTTFYLLLYFFRFSEKVHTVGQPNLVSIFLTSKSRSQLISRSSGP